MAITEASKSNPDGGQATANINQESTNSLKDLPQTEPADNNNNI